MLMLQAVTNKLGSAAGACSRSFEWGTFQDLEQSVVDDLKKLEESPLVPDDVTLLGLIYDVSSTACKPLASIVHV